MKAISIFAILALLAVVAVGASLKDLKAKVDASEMGAENIVQQHAHRSVRVADAAAAAASAAAARIKPLSVEDIEANIGVAAEARKKRFEAMSAEMPHIERAANLKNAIPTAQAVKPIDVEALRVNAEIAREDVDEQIRRVQAMSKEDMEDRRKMIDEMRQKAAEARERAGQDRAKWMEEINEMIQNMKNKRATKDEL